MEEDKEFGVSLVEANDIVFGAFGGVGEQDVAAFGALGWGFRQDGVAVGANSFITESLDQFASKAGETACSRCSASLWISYHSMPKISVSMRSTR